MNLNVNYINNRFVACHANCWIQGAARPAIVKQQHSDVAKTKEISKFSITR